MTGKLRTRVNASGYRQFFDEQQGRWVFTHRRVAEKKIGREPAPGEEVHHVNGDKQDNRSRNLVVLKDSIHERLHSEDPDACFRCGRSGHWAEDCYAARDFEGDDIDEDEESFEDDWDDDDWDDDDDEF